MDKCIFCQIANRETPTKLEYDDNEIVAFSSIDPKAKVHLLIVPKKHIQTLEDIKDEESNLIGQMIIVAKNLAKIKGIQNAYKLAFNGGKYQQVKHIHLHLLGGDNLDSVIENI